MKLKDLVETKEALLAEGVNTNTLHAKVKKRLIAAGYKHDTQETQGGSVVSWFTRDTNKLDDAGREKLAKSLDMEEHKHADALHYNPKTYFVNSHYDLKLNADSAILRTHKVTRAGDDSRMGKE